MVGWLGTPGDEMAGLENNWRRYVKRKTSTVMTW